MILLHPAWLLLAIPLGVALWLWPLPSRWLLGLRVATLTLLLLAMSGLALRLPSRAGTVVVVADRSASMPADSDAAHKEAVDLVQAAMGPDDRLAVLSFGQQVAVEQRPQAAKFAGFTAEVGGDASNLGEALRQALALIPPESPGRILVLSDGHWTGHDPAAEAVTAAARGVAIDYRARERPAANDLAVARIDAPPSVAPEEAFLITAWVHAPLRQAIAFELRRGDRRLEAGTRQLASGLNRLTFRDRASGPGTLSYTLTVTGAVDDPVPENNAARLLVGVRGPRPILAVTSRRSGLPRLLRAGGLPIQAARPEACTWTLEALSQYAAVVLENVPADTIGNRGMETLAAWVQETGSGLMMTGGRDSYGTGGYFQSPLEPILPVSMELRNEHRKLALAIVVALDRSGSMAAAVGGGKVKMDLANLGTAQVLDLLGPQDEFGVLAVDTQAHVIAELAAVKDKAKVRQDVLRINSQGGGIYIYEALAAASKMILDAKSGTKHIILFADAADSEQPGKYQELLDKVRGANITVSVIGLGKPADKDAELLRDIARRGRGRCFFTDNPEELPRLFAQDTFVVARSTFLDEKTAVRSTAGLTTLLGRPWDVRQTVGGYNLCYLRPEANLAAVTLDEYRAPVVAAWQAKLGRVLCYTGEADGQYTGPIARWAEVGDFFTSLARWTAGHAGNLPDNMLVTQDLMSGQALVRLHLDPERKQEPFSGLPRVAVLRELRGQAPQAEYSVMRWTSADTLEAEVPLRGSETALATVVVPGQKPLALPPVCLPYSPEFRPAEPGQGLPALEALARATGGKERVDLAGVWQELPKQPRRIEIARWLLFAALALLLLEVLERRTGLLAGQRLIYRRERVPLAVSRSQPPPATGPTAKKDAAPVPTAAAEKRGGLADALKQARKRASERTQGP